MNWPWRPFQQDGKYGYIDRLGDTMVKPVWDDVLNGKSLCPLDYYSHHMLLPVKLGDKWGMVNGDNELLIPPRFDKMGGFFECDDGKQYANVAIKQGQEFLTALISADGTIIVGPLKDADVILPNGFVIFSKVVGKKVRCGIRSFNEMIVVPCKYTTIHVCPTNIRMVTLSKVDCDEGCRDIYRIQLYSNYPNAEVFRTEAGNGYVISLN